MSTQTLERTRHDDSWYNTREFLFGRPLTAREVDLINLAADGLTDAEIAARLGRSEDAVTTSLRRAEKKLGVNGRTAAVATLYRRRVFRPTDVPERPSVHLSSRQLAVLLLLVRGLTTEEIAQEQCLGIETARSHIKRLRKRLGARNRAHAIRRGVDTGVLRLERKGGPRS